MQVVERLQRAGFKIACSEEQQLIARPAEAAESIQQKAARATAACTCGLAGATSSDCAYLAAAAVRHSYASSGCCGRTMRAMSVRATALQGHT